MKKFIIIVSVYDQENTQAYPLGGVFETHEQAEQYISDHVAEVKSNHWCSDRVDGKYFYKEEFSIGGSFHAQDSSDGASLDIVIYEVPDMTGKFPVGFASREEIDIYTTYDGDEFTDDDLEGIANEMDSWYRNGYSDCFGNDLRDAAERKHKEKENAL